MKNLLLITCFFSTLHLQAKERVISAAEYHYALSIFPHEFPEQYQIYINDGIGLEDRAYVRPGGILKGSLSKIYIYLGKDYENPMQSNLSLFTHELTHVWQLEHFGITWSFYQAFCNMIVKEKIQGKNPYTFSCTDANKMLSEFNSEQQAEIVECAITASNDNPNKACAKRLLAKIQNESQYKLMIGSDARDIAASNNGDLYITNTAGLIYKYNGTVWQQLPGSAAVSISANAGKILITNTAGKMYEWTNNTWVQLSGSDATDVAVSHTGEYYMVNSAGKIYKYNFSTTKWIQLAGSDASRISANMGGVCMVNTGGKIYAYNDGTRKWSQISGGDGKDIGSDANGNFYLTNTQGLIYKWTLNNRVWVQQPGSNAVAISGNNEKIFLVNTKGRIYTSK